MRRFFWPFLVAVGVILSTSGFVGCNYPLAHHDAHAAIFQAFNDVGLTAKATDVADCESNLNPNAINTSGVTPNRGLFQIDDIWAAHWAETMGVSFWTTWMDPYFNAQFARVLWNEQGWTPWTTGGGICG